MKLRVADRILVALAGLLLLAVCAGIVAQMFFQVDLIAFAAKIFSNESFQARAALIGLAVFLLLLGCYCVFVLFRHRKRKDKFILQKNDSGELVISLKALENMIQKCLDQHDELNVQNLYLENRKDGLLIRIRGSVAGGISIPLTVEALQKQIKQYVTACSGVEVKGIRVQIDSSGKDAENAPFAIEAPTAKPLLKESEERPAKTSADLPEDNSVSSTPEAESVAGNPSVSSDEEDDRPLHQRLFSPKQEPCIVPEPPAEAVQVVEEDVQEPVQNEDAVPDQGFTGDDAVSDSTETIAEDHRGPFAGENIEESDGEAESKADPEFLESLKAFDSVVTGNGEG